MRKINYIQSGILLVTLSLAGCAANNAGNNPLATADSSLAAVGGAAQSGQQILNSGVAIANPAATQQIGLVDILVRQLGVSPQQAMGGAGAIFQVAQGNMNPQAFNSLSQSVPGMSTMLGAAPAMPAAGGLTSLMGNSGSSLGSVAALTGSFQQLNLSPNMVSQFIPVVTNYVRQTGGQATADLLQSALGMR
ncbi:MAG: DUF2780 domain-containing protein [Nitrosomonas sp.]|nr:DUF2780 domain-containing protein [Nitrosomonas sp.]MBP7111972.1 DUF2780 domain-containing protein [Nitrosomonas sp.]